MNVFHSLSGGKLFGIFFSLGGACSKELTGAGYPDREAFLMFRAGFGYHGIDGWGQMVRLGVLDEAAFVVMFRGYDRLVIGMLNDMPDNKIESRLDAFVEIDGADKGFEGVGKGGFTDPDFMVIGRFAEEEMLAKVKAAGKSGEGLAVDNLRSIA